MFGLGVLTVSTSGAQGNREDTSGQAIREILTADGFEVVRSEIVPDDYDTIAAKLSEWADAPDVNLIVSTGGTGWGGTTVRRRPACQYWTRKCPAWRKRCGPSPWSSLPWR